MARQKSIDENTTSDKELESLKTLPIINPIPVAKEDSVLVKIRPNKSFRMRIGGKIWEFSKDELIFVPESVKSLLHERGDLGAV